MKIKRWKYKFPEHCDGYEYSRESIEKELNDHRWNGIIIGVCRTKRNYPTPIYYKNGYGTGTFFSNGRYPVALSKCGKYYQVFSMPYKWSFLDDVRLSPEEFHKQFEFIK